MSDNAIILKSLKTLIKVLVAASVAEAKIKHDLATAISLSNISGRDSDLAETHRKELKEAQAYTRDIQEMIDADFALLIG